MMPTQVYQKWPDTHFTGTNNTLFTLSSTMPKVLFILYILFILLWCNKPIWQIKYLLLEIKNTKEKLKKKKEENLTVLLYPILHKIFFHSSLHQVIISELDYKFSCDTVNQDWHHWSTWNYFSFYREQRQDPCLPQPGLQSLPHPGTGKGKRAAVCDRACGTLPSNCKHHRSSWAGFAHWQHILFQIIYNRLKLLFLWSKNTYLLNPSFL